MASAKFTENSNRNVGIIVVESQGWDVGGQYDQ